MKILVLCTGNSCRSQMAEGFFRRFLGRSHTVRSAGLTPKAVHPIAIQVMKESGIDISRHSSNHVNEYVSEHFDYVITVCDSAAASCPSFPGQTIRLHWPFDDPALASGPEDEIVDEFRRIRDEIEKKVRGWITNTEQK